MSDDLRDELVKLTCDLMRYPSTEDQPEQLQAVLGYVEAYIQDIPDLVVERSEAAGKPALVITLHPTRRPALMLNAHLDVVAARPDQFVPDIRDGRIYGRGSQDMKGAAAVALRLLRDLAALEPRPDVGFQFVTDEEIGGNDGTRRLLAEGWECATFIALEPTDLGICYEQKGIMWVELSLPGAPAHGSRPWEGTNPIHALVDGLTALNQRYPHPTQEIWRTTVTPTVTRAGGASKNQVPPQAELVFDIRFVAPDSVDSLVAMLHECFPTATITLLRSSNALIADPNDAQLQRLAAVTAAHTGKDTRFYREHFASDARFYTAAGITAVCYGPVGAGLHTDNEWVSIDGLVDLYQCLMTFCQG